MNTLKRKGAVYPWMRSAGLGYFYGAERIDADEDFKGICSQIAPKCGGVWDHLEYANEYDGGKISRTSIQKLAGATE
jgi:hypothetical protein